MQKKELTIHDTEEKPIDTLAGYVKGGIGTVPVVGPILAEMIGSLIPGQRLDRVSEFLKIIDRKIGEMGEEIDILKLKMTDEKFLDLFVEVSWQSTKASSRERKEYLASILINGLNDDNLDEIQKNIFLNLMSELNDIEILILYSKSYKGLYEDADFQVQYQKTLIGPITYIGSP